MSVFTFNTAVLIGSSSLLFGCSIGSCAANWKCEENLNLMKPKPKEKTRLIVAASEKDPDMLYATRFFAPDAFIFLEQNGKRTLVLSDLEIDRGRKQAEADEILPYSEFEKEVQGASAQGPGLRESAWRIS